MRIQDFIYGFVFMVSYSGNREYDYRVWGLGSSGLRVVSGGCGAKS
jgi:hypothetical protein